MTQLTERQIQTLKLIRRSPDKGDGWRTVSKACWPLLEDAPIELIERKVNENGGMCRFTEEGNTVMEWML